MLIYSRMFVYMCVNGSRTLFIKGSKAPETFEAIDLECGYLVVPVFGKSICLLQEILLLFIVSLFRDGPVKVIFWLIKFVSFPLATSEVEYFEIF